MFPFLIIKKPPMLLFAYKKSVRDGKRNKGLLLSALFSIKSSVRMLVSKEENGKRRSWASVFHLILLTTWR